MSGSGMTTRSAEDNVVAIQVVSSVGQAAKKPQKRLSDTDMECPECKYTTKFATGFISHLSYTHDTTLFLAGRALLCECGNESLSAHHAVKSNCSIRNFTVIRKRKGPIRRLTDAKTTPKCLKCEKYPRTVYGYATHLYEYHNKTTLESVRHYLKCSCGKCFYSAKEYPDHTAECNGRSFTLKEYAVYNKKGQKTGVTTRAGAEKKKDKASSTVARQQKRDEKTKGMDQAAVKNEEDSDDDFAYLPSRDGPRMK